MYKNEFKDSQGRYLTQACFVETCAKGSRYLPTYTLKDEDFTKSGTTYKSLKRLYLELSDPTEYEFANAYLGGYPHWEILVELVWFLPHVTQWRKELHLQMQAESVRKMRSIADTATQESTRANALRWLATSGWDKETGAPAKGKPGRPSNKPKTEAGDEPANSHLADDAARIHLVK